MARTAATERRRRTGARAPHGPRPRRVVAAALDLVEREGAGRAHHAAAGHRARRRHPTIYWHVGSRDELVAAVIRLQSERLAEPTGRRATTPASGSSARPATSGRRSIEHRAITSLAHQTGTSLAARPAASRRRSSPSSRPPASRARPRPTLPGRSSSSSPAPWSWRCATARPSRPSTGPTRCGPTSDAPIAPRPAPRCAPSRTSTRCRRPRCAPSSTTTSADRPDRTERGATDDRRSR